MNIVIKPECSGTHQNERYTEMIYMYVNDDDYLLAVIDGIEVFPVLKAGKWWIIPNNAKNDDAFDAIGPYDNAEEVVVMLRLMATEYELYSN
jgi:hypothetical protein